MAYNYQQFINACKMIMYADHTVVYTASKTIDDSFAILERNLCEIINWCNNNRLTLNISKTKHMIIGPGLKENIAVVNNLQYKDKKIDIVNEYNYLGIELDNKLTLENHINKALGLVIYYGEGGFKMRNLRVQNFLRPPLKTG